MRCDAQLAKTRIKWAGEISGLNCPVGELSVVKFVGGGIIWGKCPGNVQEELSGKISEFPCRITIILYV